MHLLTVQISKSSIFHNSRVFFTTSFKCLTVIASKFFLARTKKKHSRNKNNYLFHSLNFKQK